MSLLKSAYGRGLTVTLAGVVMMCAVWCMCVRENEREEKNQTEWDGRMGSIGAGRGMEGYGRGESEHKTWNAGAKGGKNEMERRKKQITRKK